MQFPQTRRKDTLPTNARRWESLDPKVVSGPGFQHFKSSGPDRDRTGGELPWILSLSLDFQPSESGRKAGLSMNASNRKPYCAPPASTAHGAPATRKVQGQG